MSFMSFNKLQLALIFLLSNTAFADTQQVMNQYFEEDEGCLDFSKFQVGKLMNLPSLLQCSLMCINTDSCRFFRISPTDNCAFLCELASFNTLPPSIHATAAPSPFLQGVRCYKIVPDNSTRSRSTEKLTIQSKNGTTTDYNANSTGRLRDCDNGNNWFSYCYEDQSSDLHQSEWLKFIDSDIPDTLMESHIHVNKNFKKGKMVFYDNVADMIQVLATHIYTQSTASFVYAMEKDEHGFVENASRIVYTGKWEGELFTNFIYPTGTSSFTKAHVKHMHIYINNPDEYSIRISPTARDLVKYIENGYQAHRFKFSSVSVVSSEKPVVSLYSINRRILFSENGKSQPPFKYMQKMLSVPGRSQTCYKLIGISGRFEDCFEKRAAAFRLSPHWKPLSQDALDETIALVGRLMIQGHKFRVAFDSGYFDVDDIIQYGKDVYFILPQDHVRGASTYFTESSVGKRAVISSNGFLSWCSHPFEGENVLDYGSSADINVSHFVDTKAWSAALSVFSSGTIAFGSVQEVADGAKGGRDVNVLIEWLNDDLKRQFTAYMLTVKGFGTPNVLVWAESEVSLSLVRQPDGKMAIDGDCNMEKVLVNSNGEVQVLVYNVHYRRPVRKETDPRITWFLH